jgi:hypothetical protein
LAPWPRSWLRYGLGTRAVLASGLGLLSTPSFAAGYVVNGHPASPAEKCYYVLDVLLCD